ncbi:MAG TPA: alpha-ketoglutarate-dependent dioxygenase AlkB [Rhodanobacteraceae bacterium]|nr:alpha-ketoglutarate-dependent dioxygenase AlkB [Rhodanobacteraceae bacterium]
MTSNPEQGERIPLAGADVRYFADAFAHDADALFEALRREIRWETHRLRLFGRTIDSPRLSCWIGDAGAAYTYSGTRFEPRAWTPAISSLREALAKRFGLRFNSVLANLYRDGRDSMGWHSDAERELGSEPAIASLSFGAPRVFRFRSRATRETALAIPLAHGSLLVMRGATQRLYQHDLPKADVAIGARVNLTFRTIVAEA